MRDFRYQVIDALKSAQIVIQEKEVRVFYEGRFMSIAGTFEGSNELTYLKPHLAMEFFVGDIAFKPTVKSITTLIKETLGSSCPHDSINVQCLNLEETAAEKWVALTRRIAGANLSDHPNDKHLVRHLYDLYHLNQYLSGEYREIIGTLIEKDRSLFKKRNLAYISDPLQFSNESLRLLNDDPQWKQHWQTFIEQMVYEPHPPTFAETLHQLNLISNQILPKLTIQEITT